MRRCLGIVVILAALGAAAYMFRSTRKNCPTVFENERRFLDLTAETFCGARDMEIPEPAKDYPPSWVLTRAFRAGDIPRDADAVRALAAAHPHPERADLWNWWRLLVYGYPNGIAEPPPRHAEDPNPRQGKREAADDNGAAAKNGAPPAANDGKAEDGGEAESIAAPPVDEDAAALWDAVVDYLEAADPDNGWPHLLRAKRDLDRSVREYAVRRPEPVEHGVEPTIRRWEVMPGDVEFAARAARAAHRAATSPRFDQALDELARVEFDRLGGRAPDYGAFLRDMAYAGYTTLLPHFQIFRGEVQRMTAEARRRTAPAAQDIADGLDARQILDDQLTLAARFIESENILISMLVGGSTINTVAENGDHILRAAGRPEDAAALVARARELGKPWALSRAAAYLRDSRPAANKRPLNFLSNAPAILAEAQAFIDAEAAAGVTARREDWGFMGGKSAATLIGCAWTLEPLPTREEARLSARFEFHGLLRLLAADAMLPLACGLLLLLAAHGLNLLRFRGMPPAAVPPWPGPWGIVAGALLFALPAAACWYGLSLLPGSPLGLALEVPFVGADSGWVWTWTIFWIFWGLLAGWNLLRGYAGGATRIWLASRSYDDVPPRRWRHLRRGFVPACLFVSAVAMLAAPFLRSIHSPDLCEAAIIIALGLGGVTALSLALQLAGICFGKSRAVYSRGRNRWVLAGLAGGILLWGLFICFLGRSESDCARRDTVLIPDPGAASTSLFTPLESRITASHRAHARAMLQEGR